MNEIHSTANPARLVTLQAVQPRVWSPLVLLTLAFAWPLYQLAQLSFTTELYSHLVLVPIVSGYFVWLKYKQLPAPTRSPRLAAVFAVLGLASLAVFIALRLAGYALPGSDGLALTILAYLLLFLAWTAYFFGAPILRALAFPAAFLVFLVPMPLAMEHGVELLLQKGSATVAYALFSVTGTPVLREDLLFHLPGISLEIAPECSGIRSSLALFITSIVAGQLYLSSPWKRALLASVVLPLALLRNGVRVCTIGELCVRIGPEMIDSFLHHHGGPVFFAASLVPFGLLLLVLVRSERRKLTARI